MDKTSKKYVEMRKKAYKESLLPYFFSYKIIKFFDGNICPICKNKMIFCNKSPTRPTIQHNMPISLGGKHVLNNISIICKTCNVSIRNNITGSLNNEKVIKVWEEIKNAK